MQQKEKNEAPGTKESEEELTAEEQQEKEYDEAFAEELPEDKTEESEEDKAKRLEAEKKAEEPQETDEEKTAREEAEKLEAEKIAAEKLESDETPDATKKALKDTKAWGTKLAQENAELKRTVQEYKNGKATATDVAKAQAAQSEASKGLKEKMSKVFEDYPELKDVLEPMLAITENVQSELSKVEKLNQDMVNSKKQNEQKAYFEAEVEPKVLEKHPEFATIKFDKEYYAWAETQSPAMKHAAMFSLDPRDLIHAVGEYKKFAGSDKFKSAQEAEEEKKAEIKKNAASLRGGGSKKIDKPKSTELSQVDKDDYDGGWDASPSK